MVHTEVSKSSDARFRSQKLASKTGRRHFVREGRSDARESRPKLASLTGRQHFVQDESSDARFRRQKLASRTGKRHFVREVHGRPRRETEPNRAQNQIGA